METKTGRLFCLGLPEIQPVALVWAVGDVGVGRSGKVRFGLGLRRRLYALGIGEGLGRLLAKSRNRKSQRRQSNEDSRETAHE